VTVNEGAGRVDKVVRMVGVSTLSWEDAARSAVHEATKTIRELSSARVCDRDIRIVDDDSLVYRTMLEVAFRYDRTRTSPTGERVQVRRYLIVGNVTLAGQELERAVEERCARGPAEFHVVAPRAPDRLGTLVLGDPASGYVATVAPGAELEATAEAAARLATFVDALRRLGAAVTGEIGPANPVRAVEAILQRASFDEIIVSTMPSGLSRWLRIDLPSRLGRTTALPITLIEAAEVSA
jgi:flavin-binding protein dodecin